MGGSDDPSNIVRLTIEEHVQAHKELYEKHGNEYDRIAFLALSGILENQDIILLTLKEAGRQTGIKNKGKFKGRTAPNKDSKMSEDQKQKISKTRKERNLGTESAKYLKRFYGDDNPMKNPKNKKKLSEKVTGRKRKYNSDGSWSWYYPNK